MSIDMNATRTRMERLMAKMPTPEALDKEVAKRLVALGPDTKVLEALVNSLACLFAYTKVAPVLLREIGVLLVEDPDHVLLLLEALAQVMEKKTPEVVRNALEERFGPLDPEESCSDTCRGPLH